MTIVVVVLCKILRYKCIHLQETLTTIRTSVCSFILNRHVDIADVFDKDETCPLIHHIINNQILTKKVTNILFQLPKMNKNKKEVFHSHNKNAGFFNLV